MKSLKKFFALALALALCFVMALPAMATDTEPPAVGGEPDTNTEYSLTMSNPLEGHSYTVYQVFTGDVAMEDGKLILSNAKYGQSYGTKGEAVPDSVMKDFAEGGKYANNASLFASDIMGKLSNPVIKDWEGETVPVAPGYYIIIDNDDNVDEDGNPVAGDAVSPVMVEVVGPTTIKQKATTTTFDKTTDSDADKDDDHNASHQIGEVFPFYLTATVPVDNLLKYETYKLIFHDTMGKGYTFSKGFGLSVTGTKDEKEANLVSSFDGFENKFDGDDGITLTRTDGENQTFDGEQGISFDITVDDLIALVGGEDTIKGLDVGSSIEVKFTYYVFLNENCIILNQTGTAVPNNVNTGWLDYPREPGSDEVGTTPKVDVTTFTFNLDAEKVDGEGNPLAGAGFTLYEVVEGERTPLEIYSDKKGNYFVWNEETADKITEKGYEAVENNEIITTGDANNLLIQGLKPGTYILSETTVPAGYNRAKDIQIVVTATEYIDEDGISKVALTVKKTYIETLDDNNKPITGPEDDSNVAGDENTTAFNVVNNKGTLLPSTGGIGTTIFYAVGGVLVVGAGVLLIVKKRLGSKG